VLDYVRRARASARRARDAAAGWGAGVRRAAGERAGAALGRLLGRAPGRGRWRVPDPLNDLPGFSERAAAAAAAAAGGGGGPGPAGGGAARGAAAALWSRVAGSAGAGAEWAARLAERAARRRAGQAGPAAREEAVAVEERRGAGASLYRGLYGGAAGPRGRAGAPAPAAPAPGRGPSVADLAAARRGSLPRSQGVPYASLGAAFRAVRVLSRDPERGLLHFLRSDARLLEPVFREVVVVAWRRWPRDDRHRLWIRMYRDIPVRSWRVVLPDRYLSFRPVDVLRVDLMSLAAVGGVLLSMRGFESGLLQLLAVLGTSGATLRALLAYYRLLSGGDHWVLRLLHKKTAATGPAALQAVACEGGLQQAAEAALALAAARAAGGGAGPAGPAGGAGPAGPPAGPPAWGDGSPMAVRDVDLARACRDAERWLEEEGTVVDVPPASVLASLQARGLLSVGPGVGKRPPRPPGAPE